MGFVESIKAIEIVLNTFRNEVVKFLSLDRAKTLSREDIDKYYNAAQTLGDNIRKEIDEVRKKEGFDDFVKKNLYIINDINSLSVTSTLLEVQLTQHYFSLLFFINERDVNGHLNKISKFLILSDDELEKIKEENNQFKKEIEDVKNLKDNLFNFFGLIVGLLAFIFVNYQFISSAKDLGIGKMLMFMGIANVGLILGIIVILGFLAHILDKESQVEKMTNALKSKSYAAAIILILVGGYAIYQREDKPKEQMEKIKMENINDKFVGLEQKINNLLDENTTKTEKIKELRSEIDTLKNKK